MKQSRGARRSPRSKVDKLSSRSTHLARTNSEKFQIGLGKYVHDVQFSQSIEPYSMDQNIDIEISENNQCTSDNNGGSDNSSESILPGRHKAVSKKLNSSNEMRIKYQKYKDDWEKYPQSQDGRRMRLTEFIWSQCKPTDECQYDKYDPRGYDMNDPRDKKLYDCVLRNKQTCREYLAELDEVAKTNSPVDSDDDLSDNLSRVSRLSQQSLVDYFGTNDSDKIEGSYHPSVLLPDSDSDSDNSSVSAKELSTNSCVVGHTPNAVNTTVPVDSTVSPRPTINNTLEHGRLKCHVPDLYYSIYNSNDSDDVKVEKFKEVNWVTDSLLEEMSRYYPTKDDVTRDPLTNAISMNKDSISLNFR